MKSSKVPSQPSLYLKRPSRDVDLVLNRSSRTKQASKCYSENMAWWENMILEMDDISDSSQQHFTDVPSKAEIVRCTLHMVVASEQS